LAFATGTPGSFETVPELLAWVGTTSARAALLARERIFGRALDTYGSAGIDRRTTRSGTWDDRAQLVREYAALMSTSTPVARGVRAPSPPTSARSRGRTSS
jgi:cobalamin biosynthesis Mg chelatase CobN